MDYLHRMHVFFKYTRYAKHKLVHNNRNKICRNPRPPFFAPSTANQKLDWKANWPFGFSASIILNPDPCG